MTSMRPRSHLHFPPTVLEVAIERVLSRCKSCQRRILWTTTRRGKKMPVDFAPDREGRFWLSADDELVLHAAYIDAHEWSMVTAGTHPQQKRSRYARHECKRAS